MFPSDDESTAEVEQHEAKKKKVSKRQRPTPSSSNVHKKPKINPVQIVRSVPSTSQPVTAAELFGSDSEDDVDVQTPAPPSGKLLSTITRRLANGSSRQTDVTKIGSHYVEMKVYRCDEIERVAPINRWRQAIVTVKNRTDENTDAWMHLSNFIIATRKEFRKCPPTFVSNYY